MKITKTNIPINTILAGLFTLGYIACVTVPAVATPPERTYFSFAGQSFPVNGLCPFEVTETILIGDVEETIFFDRDGNITLIHDFVREQDAFTVNGITLIGMPYTASIFTYFEDGEVTNVVAQGVLEKVLLPDGSLFIGAGRVDPFTGFALDPDHGAFLNLDAFCAALSP